MQMLSKMAAGFVLGLVLMPAALLAQGPPPAPGTPDGGANEQTTPENTNSNESSSSGGEVASDDYCYRDPDRGDSRDIYFICYEEQENCENSRAVGGSTCETKSSRLEDRTNDFQEFHFTRASDPSASPRYCFQTLTDVSYEGETHQRGEYFCYENENACNAATENFGIPQGNFSNCERENSIPPGSSTKQGESFEGGVSPVTRTEVGGGDNDADEGGSDDPTSYENGGGGGLVQCKSGCGFEELMALLKRVVEFLLISVAAPVASIMFVYAGFLYITAAGNPEKASQAKQIFILVLLGFVIALAAWLVVNAFLQGLGVKSAFNFLSGTP